MKRLIAVVLIVLGTASLAWAAKTAEQTLVKLVSKVAPSDAHDSKSICLCRDPGLEKRVGRTVHYEIGGEYQLNCILQTFNSAGNAVASTDCDEFQVLR